MRVLVGALVLGCCAYLSSARLQDWRSDEAIWAAAVAVSPEAPRPAVNLAVALQRRGAINDAVMQAVRAAQLASDRLDTATREAASALLLWIDVMHTPICDQPAVLAWCASSR